MNLFPLLFSPQESGLSPAGCWGTYSAAVTRDSLYNAFADA